MGGIYKKIQAVMVDAGYLQKDDNVRTGGSGSYKAISEEKVTETVRKALIKHGLVIFPVEQKHRRDDTILKKANGDESVSRLSTVDTTYKIVDVDTGESEMLCSSGTGVDTQDKGVGKAMTYSYKYMLLRTFAIPTGEDPDKISSDVLDQQQRNEPKAGAQTPSGDTNHSAPKTGEVISEAQAKRLFAIAKGGGKEAKAESVRMVIEGYGYKKTSDILKSDYQAISDEIESMPF